jgi:hypothetical protein
VKPESDDSSKSSSARRRLVRGVFGVPAVLALYSGSARANPSINTCLINQNGLSKSTQPVTTSNDGLWLRYQLYAYVRIANPTLSSPLGTVRTQDGYWIKGSELDSFNRAGQRHWVGSSSWCKFDVVGNVTQGIGTPLCSAATQSNWALQKVNHWVALRVDSAGKIVGAGNSSSGSAVAASCWNSFAAGTAAT